MTQRSTRPEPGQDETPRPHPAGGRGGVITTDPSSKVFPTEIDRQIAIREGIRMERERTVRLMLSGQYKHEPAQDVAMVIHNGIHWGPDYA